MRVLLQGRRDLRRKPGGDAVHIDMLARLLPASGASIQIATSTRPELNDVDLVHLFNIGRVDETYAQWLNARKNGVPAVCTPIYSPRRRLERYELEGWYGWKRQLPRFVPDFERRQELKTLLRCLTEGRPGLWAKQCSVGFRGQQLAVLKGVKKVIVDTRAEADALAADFDLNDLAVAILPLGVDAVPSRKPLVADLPSGMPDAGYVLCPARIEPLKNQLAMMRALEDTNLDVVFAGHLSRRHRSYASRFLAAVKGNSKWHYLGYIPGETLALVYASAGVVVVPSWVENCCLAAVEGAMHGSPAVVTTESYTQEYLGGGAFYCDPASPDSIRKAVLAALERGRAPESAFTRLSSWEDHARSTVEVYRQCVGNTR